MWGFESLRPHQYLATNPSRADAAQCNREWKASEAMQIVETANEGLKRGYTVTIPARDISARIEGEVTTRS